MTPHSDGTRVERMTGSKYFAQALKGYGVTHVFFVPAVFMPALAEMDKLGIVCVMAHAEKGAAYMADGFARAGGRPGLCFCQTVGEANMAAALKDAFLAGSPVISVTGGRAPESQHMHVYQEIDDFSLFRPVTKDNWRVEAVNAFPGSLRQAFRTATTGAPGPVHFELSGRAASLVEQEGDMDLTVEPRFGRIPPFRPRPEAADIEAAARALESSERPIIVAGGGVTSSGAAAELVQLAEKLSIPVATSLNGKGCIAEDHRLSVGVVGTYSRSCANRAVSEADLVFFVGSHTGDQVTNDWRIPQRGIRVIQLDIDASELGRSYSNEVSILGDAKVALAELAQASHGSGDRAQWVAGVQGLVKEWRAANEPQMTSNAVPMRPERVCREIQKALPQDAILVSDTGHSGIWTGSMIELKPGQRFLRAAGSLGWSFPASLGAKCAQPNRPVITFTGDGGFYYHLTELETAVRFGINTVTVVNNNGSENQELRMMDRAYNGQQTEAGRKIWNFVPVNFANLAETMGAKGIRVERPADLPDALNEALRADRPVVIDAVTDIMGLAAPAWAG